MFTPDTASDTVRRFRYDLRQGIRQAGLDFRRLPAWARQSRVRAGWIDSSLVAVFEGADSDAYQPVGPVRSDSPVLFDTPDFAASRAAYPLRDTQQAIVITGGASGDVDIAPGEAPDALLTIISIPIGSALFNAGYAGPHGPVALINIALHGHLPDAPSEVVAARFIPFALYLHERELAYPGHAWHAVAEHLLHVLTTVSTSRAGDFYETELHQRRRTTFGHAERALAMTKENGVIVLGSYSPSSSEEELRALCDALAGGGYDARLIRDFEEIPMMSNEEKVRLWCSAARFCVMVDRGASGHILEYGILRDQRVITAFLQPEQGGSTFMIGDSSLVDVRYIKRFTFDDTPLAAVPEVVSWAEAFVKERSDAYGAAYPWR
jgi:hypothetical protein